MRRIPLSRALSAVRSSSTSSKPVNSEGLSSRSNACFRNVSASPTTETSPLPTRQAAHKFPCRLNKERVFSNFVAHSGSKANYLRPNATAVLSGPGLLDLPTALAQQQPQQAAAINSALNSGLSGRLNNQAGAIASIRGLIKSVWSTHQPTPITTPCRCLSAALWTVAFFSGTPAPDPLNPTFIIDSGLAQPPVGQLRTSGRNVVRLDPLIEFDPTLSRQFALKERLNFKLQPQVFHS